jgi:hypothetical protein
MSMRTLWYILALSLVVILFGAVWFVRNRGTASASALEGKERLEVTLQPEWSAGLQEWRVQ